MPIANQQIGQTAPKVSTLQFRETRIQGLTFHIPAAAGVSSCSNNRIVTLQEDANGNRYAVLYPEAVIRSGVQLIVIGWGVLEEALQSGGISSISPTPNTFVDGDTVTVLRDVAETYMIDYDPNNVPTVGIGTANVDEQGRLTGAAIDYSGPPIALQGAVFKSVPGLQMANQRKTNTLYYQMKDAVTP